MREILLGKLVKDVLMKLTKPLVYSFLFYASGICSLLVADLYIAANFTKQLVANWAFYKSTIMILGSLCLMGYDQVLVRNPSILARLNKSFVLQSVIISMIGSIAIFIVREGALNSYLLLTVNVFLFALVLYLSAIFRANNKLIAAQLTTNGWKIILLLLIVAPTIEDPALWFAIALFTITMLSLVFFGKQLTHLDNIKESLDNPRVVGLLFLFHNLTLIFAIYGEQFLINLFGDTDASYILYMHFVVFTPVAISLNGFIGFYLGPKIRRIVNPTPKYFQKLQTKINYFSIVVTIISIVIGWFAFLIFFHEQEANIVIEIVIALGTLCYVRCLYIFPSTCLGVFADSTILLATVKANWAFLGLFIASICIVLIQFDGLQAASLISWFGAIHWTLRYLLARYFTKKVIEQKVQES